MSLSELEAQRAGYETVEARMRTYKGWPSTSKQTPIDLARAGLIYTGIDDKVKCVFCLGAMYNWEDHDVPMEEHTKHYPACTYVKYTLLNGKIPNSVPLTPATSRSICEQTTLQQTQTNREVIVAAAVPTQPQNTDSSSFKSSTQPTNHSQMDYDDLPGKSSLKQPQQSASIAIENNPVVKIVQRLGYSLELIQKAVNLKQLELATVTTDELIDALYDVEEDELTVPDTPTSQVMITAL
jgi:hypothetical protein